jgi:predicted TIM-barrel fold metal-dependent hydrolase
MEQEIALQDYVPVSQLVSQVTQVEKPRFPVIDAHNHLGEEFGGNWVGRPVSELLDVLDQSGVRVLVDLDGGWGEHILENHLDHFKQAAPERFMHFGGVDWSTWSEQGDHFGEGAADRLHAQVLRGAQGLKIWKGLGLHVRDQHGELVPVDDARLDPIWQAAGELDIPVLVHVADPVAFFEPLDASNERWEELHAHPDWHFPHPDFPRFNTVITQFSSLVLRHSQTTFIGAHVGCYAENLACVANLLDEASNLYVDIAARISELGRQPYGACRFFERYADRILFGTDLAPDVDMYRLYYRFLESDDEYFNYSRSPIPDQGRWSIYGLHLAEDILQKVYFKNAQKALNLKGDLP